MAVEELVNDNAPFDCPDCTLTVKHDHPKPMMLVSPGELLAFRGPARIPTNNEERATVVVDQIRSMPDYLHDAYVEVALDAAEARGRAELAAKVEALAAELENDAESAITPGYYRDAADRVRSLAAEVAGGCGYDQPR